MAYLTEYTNWSEYLGTQLAIAEIDERYSEAKLDKGKIILKVNLKSTAGREEAANNEDLWALQDEYQERSYYRKLIESLFNNNERKSATISREITRRVNRASREDRRDRYGN